MSDTQGAAASQSYPQFLRAISLVVLPSGGGQGLDLSDFHIKFHVEGMSFDRPKSAVIRVYNLAASTQATIKAEFQAVMLQAGYENGALGIIFSGTIKRFRSGRENATDTYLEILAADGDPLAGLRTGWDGHEAMLSETLIGLLRADPSSYLSVNPGFRPFLGTDLALGATPDPSITGNRSYTRAHFLYYAGVVTPGTYR